MVTLKTDYQTVLLAHIMDAGELIEQTLLLLKRQKYILVTSLFESMLEQQLVSREHSLLFLVHFYVHKLTLIASLTGHAVQQEIDISKVQQDATYYISCWAKVKSDVDPQFFKL